MWSPPCLRRCINVVSMFASCCPVSRVFDGMSDLKPLIRLGPAFSAAVVTIHLGNVPDSGLPAYVIEAPFLFRREGNPYVGPDGSDWIDNHRRFALLGWAAAHLAAGELDADWQPDVVHAHDWHAVDRKSYSG